MKKLIAILIAAIMVFALVACSSNGGKETGTETGGETTPATESAEGTESAEATESAADATESAGAPDTEADTSMTGVPNPVVEGDKAAVDALGMDLGVPSTAENIRYSVIDGKIAQIDFTYQGKAFCLRASKEEGDIAGLYGETVATKDLAVGGGKLTQIADGESTYYKAEWVRDGANYALTNTDGATEIQVIEVYEEVRY